MMQSNLAYSLFVLFLVLTPYLKAEKISFTDIIWSGINPQWDEHKRRAMADTPYSHVALHLDVRDEPALYIRCISCALVVIRDGRVVFPAPDYNILYGREASIEDIDTKIDISGGELIYAGLATQYKPDEHFLPSIYDLLVLDERSRKISLTNFGSDLDLASFMPSLLLRVSQPEWSERYLNKRQIAKMQSRLYRGLGNAAGYGKQGAGFLGKKAFECFRKAKTLAENNTWVKSPQKVTRGSGWYGLENDDDDLDAHVAIGTTLQEPVHLIPGAFPAAVDNLQSEQEDSDSNSYQPAASNSPTEALQDPIVSQPQSSNFGSIRPMLQTASSYLWQGYQNWLGNNSDVPKATKSLKTLYVDRIQDPELDFGQGAKKGPIEFKHIDNNFQKPFGRSEVVVVKYSEKELVVRADYQVDGLCPEVSVIINADNTVRIIGKNGGMAYPTTDGSILEGVAEGRPSISNAFIQPVTVDITGICPVESGPPEDLVEGTVLVVVLPRVHIKDMRSVGKVMPIDFLGVYLYFDKDGLDDLTHTALQIPTSFTQNVYVMVIYVNPLK